MINLERSGKNFSVLRKINFSYRNSEFHNVFQILVRSQIFEKLLQQKKLHELLGRGNVDFLRNEIRKQHDPDD